MEVMNAFNDTFSILKTKKEYFGIPERVNNQIDEALFLNQDSNECMLIVLQKPFSPDFVFGTARMVRGAKEDSKWKFKVSMEFTFEKDYFNLYKDNNFESLSNLARYNVLTEGDIKRKGCEIDDEYWFVHLKK